jgi:hypothetical protein
MKLVDKINEYSKINSKIITKYNLKNTTFKVNEKYSYLMNVLKNEDILYTLEYKIVGVYNKNKHIWQWAHTIPGISKCLTDYEIEFEEFKNKLKKDKENDYVKKLLTTDKIKIFIEDVDFLVNLSFYILKGKFFIAKETGDRTMYLIINNIY